MACGLANLVTQHRAHTHCYYLCPHELASFLLLWQNNWGHLFINWRINKESRFVLAPSVAGLVMNRRLCCFWPSVSQHIMKEVHGEAKSHFRDQEKKRKESRVWQALSKECPPNSSPPQEPLKTPDIASQQHRSGDTPDPSHFVNKQN